MPKVPSQQLIQPIVELKQRNPRFGCRRIAQQIAKAFGVDIDKDLVRRVPTEHYRYGSEVRWARIENAQLNLL